MQRAARQMFFIGGRRLPYDAEVEYLESTGTQYIRTGIIADSTCVLELDCAILDSGGTSVIIGQTYATSAFPNSRFAVGTASNNTRFYCGCGNLNYTTGKVKDALRHRFKLDAPSKKFYIDNISYTISWTSFAVPTELGQNMGFLLFARGMVDTGSVSPYCKARIFSCKLLKGNSLVFDFQPVRFTNELGQSEGAMYDRLGVGGMNPDGSARTDGLYRNRGTGTLVPGPDKT